MFAVHKIGSVIAVAILAAGVLSPGLANAGCEGVPADSPWAGAKSQERLTRYVNSRYDGDWQRYLTELYRSVYSANKAMADGRAVKLPGGKQLRGDKLNAYVRSLAQLLPVADCLADAHRQAAAEARAAAAAEAAKLAEENESFASFETAAGGQGSSAAELEDDGQTAVAAPIASRTFDMDDLGMRVVAHCRPEYVEFRVTNLGEQWPSRGRIKTFRTSDDKQITKRSMRFRKDQTASFKVRKKKFGEIGLWIDPTWQRRTFAYDAFIDCRPAAESAAQ